MMYDHQKSKFKEVFNVSYDEILDSELKNGLYHINDEYFFDILVRNFDHKNLERRKIIICFSGAVTDRKSKIAPFFSGEGIASKLRVPLVAFSDPVVSGTDLNLAWYAGSNEFSNLQTKILLFLKNLVSVYDAELIFFWGSGGGFAALHYATALQLPAKCLVWNPQVKIENYIPVFVDKYLKAAFDVELKSHEQKINFLKTKGICHDITELKPNPNLSLVYLQNINDKLHIENHLFYFKEKYYWCELNESTFFSGRKLLHFGDWGDGHAMPQRHIIQNILDKLISDQPLLKCLNGMDEIVERDKCEVDSLILSGEYKIFPVLSVEEESLVVEIKLFDSIGEVKSKDLTFACYMKYGEEVVEKKMYQSSNQFVIGIDSTKRENISVTCYVRDKNRKVIMNNFKAFKI